ncbi:hypothetical protein LCGC14_2778450 [marine sediment metagenome]|uniref:Uncharacterized protein n=1 Tax=marine sediment metagenome TaxID=412755 RepID=A0A0F9B2U0_9ZZZZ
MSEQGKDTEELLRSISSTSASLRVIEDGDVCNRTLLWRGVILRAFQDAGWDLNDVQMDIKYRDAFNIRASALIWLRGNSEDFHKVCDFAKCDPKGVKIAAKDIFGALIHELQIPIDVYDARDLLAARGVES